MTLLGVRKTDDRPVPVAGPRWAVPAVCVLGHVIAVRPGPPVSVADLAAAVATLLGAGCGLLTAARQSRPREVAVGVTALYVGQLLLAGPVLPVAPAVASYGVSRRVAVPAGPGLAVALAAAIGGAVVGRGAGDLAVSYVAALLLAILAGLARAAEAARAAAASDRAVAAERIRIARDLHDVVGHGMSAITVSAGSARLAIRNGLTDEAVRALSGIETAGREVLRNVRWLVGLLREHPDAATLTDVPALVQGMQRAGLSAVLNTRGDLGAVDPVIGEVAYRIVQEALTNALRHSGAATVDVDIALGQNLEIDVVDDGVGTATGWAEGNGVRGMRERVAAVAGRMECGPIDAGTGWRVHVEIPLARVR